MNRVGNVRVGARGDATELHIHLDGQRFDTRHALGRVFGVDFFCVGVDMTGQGHHAVGDFNTNVLGLHRRLPLQFSHDVFLQLLIGFHDLLSSG